MRFDHEASRRLLGIVRATAAREIDCDEFLARAGAYVEALASSTSKDLDALVVQHLRVCSECKEEVETLIRALEG